jgi:hypothetical protein
LIFAQPVARLADNFVTAPLRAWASFVRRTVRSQPTVDNKRRAGSLPDHPAQLIRLENSDDLELIDGRIQAGSGSRRLAILAATEPERAKADQTKSKSGDCGGLGRAQADGIIGCTLVGRTDLTIRLPSLGTVPVGRRVPFETPVGGKNGGFGV